MTYAKKRKCMEPTDGEHTAGKCDKERRQVRPTADDHVMSKKRTLLRDVQRERTHSKRRVNTTSNITNNIARYEAHYEAHQMI